MRICAPVMNFVARYVAKTRCMGLYYTTTNVYKAYIVSLSRRLLGQIIIGSNASRQTIREISYRLVAALAPFVTAYSWNARIFIFLFLVHVRLCVCVCIIVWSVISWIQLIPMDARKHTPNREMWLFQSVDGL